MNSNNSNRLETISTEYDTSSNVNPMRPLIFQSTNNTRRKSANIGQYTTCKD